MQFFILFASLVQLTAAIQWTCPKANATLTKGKTYEVAWTSVDTDPTTFSIYLVNFVIWPPFYTPLLLDTETSANRVSVKIPCGIENGCGYQLNAINGTNVYVIYAQTDKFTIEGCDCTDPATAASATAAIVPDIKQEL